MFNFWQVNDTHATYLIDGRTPYDVYLYSAIPSQDWYRQIMTKRWGTEVISLELQQILDAVRGGEAA